MRRSAQSGHALAEMLAIVLVAIPLLLLVPMVGKLQDMRHAVQMASRSVAFDATVSHSGSHGFTPQDQLADEIRARHFAAEGGGLQTGQRPSGEGTWSRPIWSDPRGNTLIARPGDVQVGWGRMGSALPEQGYTPSSDAALFNLIPLARADRMGLQAPGVLTGRVAVQLARLPQGVSAWEPFSQIDLNLQASTSLLVDSWGARSPDEVERRVAGLTSIPGDLSTALSRAAGLGIEVLELGRVPAPRVGQLEVWRDVVPTDRLRARSAP